MKATTPTTTTTTNNNIIISFENLLSEWWTSCVPHPPAVTGNATEHTVL